jgi:hypothetical protein
VVGPLQVPEVRRGLRRQKGLCLLSLQWPGWRWWVQLCPDRQGWEILLLLAELLPFLLQCCDFLPHLYILCQLTCHVGALALPAALGPGGVAAASWCPPGGVSRVGVRLGRKSFYGLGVPECTPRLSAAALGVARGRVPSRPGITDRAACQLLD